jgi:F-type H+-transporting ATPase subunit delta
MITSARKIKNIKIISLMTLKKTEVEVLSKRYAKALFDFSNEQKIGEVLSSDLAALSQIIAENANLSRALSSPLVSKIELGKVLSEVSDKAGLNAELKKFLVTLSENRRAFLLPKISENLQNLFDVAAGRIKVEVTSAEELTSAQLESISNNIQKSTNSKPVIKNLVDKSLIGGLTVKIGSKLFDDSIKGRLDRLKLHLTN